jgi:hypothetical protein
MSSANQKSTNSGASNSVATNSGAVMGGTPFVWSKLVAGKKTSLLDTQAEEQRKVDEKQKKADEAEKAWREKIEKKKNEEEEKRKKELEQIRIDELRLTQKYSAENGHWNHHSGDSHDEVRHIPPFINAHALKFAQGFLYNFGKKAGQCTTLFQLQELFCQAYCPYAIVTHQRSCDNFLFWEKKKYPDDAASADAADAYDRYSRMQEWMLEEKKKWEATPKSQQHGSNAPWARSSLWIFVSNVNFVNFLQCIDERFGVFEKGILKNTSSFALESPIEWKVSLDPYVFTHFQEKPACTAKRQRKGEELDDDCGLVYVPRQWDARRSKWSD